MPEINRREHHTLDNLPEVEKIPTQDLSGSREGGFEFDKEKEITQENIQEVQNITTPQQQAPKTKVKYSLGSITGSAQTQAIREMDEKRKVDTLAMVAFEKGISQSISLAKRLQDPYILDALHDKMIGELREELIKRGRLKNL
jgi:hypothetical protein